jgi:DNA polymerase III subunit delta'
MTFVYGQNRVKTLLASSISKGRLAHAYLFHGQPGVGKDAMAIGMAMGLNCSENTFGGCGACVSCMRTVQYANPSFRMVFPFPTRPKSMKEEKYFSLCREALLNRIRNPYVEPDAFSDLSTLPVIGIEDIAGLKRELALKPTGLRHRVFLVSHAERMTVPASNSLLKMLEEPPEGAVFFLTTATPGRLLPTIISRCQKMRFDTLSELEISKALQDRWQMTEEQAGFFAGFSGGSLQRAIELSQDGFQEKRDAILGFLEATFSPDVEIRHGAAEVLLEDRGKAEVLFLLHILTILLRDLLCLQPGTSLGLLNADRRERLHLLMTRMPHMDAGRGLEAVGQAIDRIEKNVYLPLAVYELSRQLHGIII